MTTLVNSTLRVLYHILKKKKAIKKLAWYSLTGFINPKFNYQVRGKKKQEFTAVSSNACFAIIFMIINLLESSQQKLVSYICVHTFVRVTELMESRF